MAGAVGVEALKAEAVDWLERNRDSIFGLSDRLFYFGEPSLEEYESAALLTEVLSEAGFVIENGISGFPTAFLASFGSGEPVVALHAEYDATPGGSQRPGVGYQCPIVEGAPGHAEGHHANATVMVASALVLKHLITKYNISGTIKVFGSPGEELNVSRPYFVRDGYFDDVDLAFHNHISDAFYTEVGQTQISLVSAEFLFSGESAHAALAPWLGRDALDAVVLMDSGMAQHREHMRPEMRAHRVITRGGEQPNVIPAQASVWWYFRAPSADDARMLFERASAIAQGAALMTQTELSVNIKSAVWPTRCNRVLAELLDRNIQEVGMPHWSKAENDLAIQVQDALGSATIGLRQKISPISEPGVPGMSSNDCGDISWKVPMGRFWFPGTIPNIRFHHWSGASALATSIAHKGTLAATKVLSGSVLEALLKPELLERTRKSFAEETRGVSYEPLVPADQQPSLGVHAALMEKYRPLMRPHYLPGVPKFTY